MIRNAAFSIFLASTIILGVNVTALALPKTSPLRDLPSPGVPGAAGPTFHEAHAAHPAHAAHAPAVPVADPQAAD